MNHCRASFESLRRERRPRPRGASRLIGPLIVVLAMAVWPTAVLAAQVAVVAQRNAIVAYIVIILLLGAVAAGLLFASPLRRRLTGSDAPRSSRSAAPAGASQSNPWLTGGASGDAGWDTTHH